LCSSCGAAARCVHVIVSAACGERCGSCGSCDAAAGMQRQHVCQQEVEGATSDDDASIACIRCPTYCSRLACCCLLREPAASAAPVRLPPAGCRCAKRARCASRRFPMPPVPALPRSAQVLLQQQPGRALPQSTPHELCMGRLQRRRQPRDVVRCDGGGRRTQCGAEH
jgi:hypothetical protein